MKSTLSSESPSALVKRTKTSTSQDQTALESFGFRPISPQLQLELHSFLLLAIITSGIPFRFVENSWFRLYQSRLARSQYKIPGRHALIQNILPQVYADYVLQMKDQLKDAKRMTLSLDGWTDNSGNSNYAVMLLCGVAIKEYVLTVEMNSFVQFGS